LAFIQGMPFQLYPGTFKTRLVLHYSPILSFVLSFVTGLAPGIPSALIDSLDDRSFFPWATPPSPPLISQAS
jgi:hypothetical protein